MDPTALAGMLFSLIVIAMVAGFILLLPITRRLGPLLEQRLNEKGGTAASENRIRQLEAAIQALRADVEQLTERQEFAESLLEERKTARLPSEQRTE
jgi:hypothetical protein